MVGTPAAASSARRRRRPWRRRRRRRRSVEYLGSGRNARFVNVPSVEAETTRRCRRAVADGRKLPEELPSRQVLSPGGAPTPVTGVRREPRRRRGWSERCADVPARARLLVATVAATSAYGVSGCAGASWIPAAALSPSEPLPRGFHNIVVCLMGVLMLMWAASVARQIVRAPDVDVRLTRPARPSGGALPRRAGARRCPVQPSGGAPPPVTGVRRRRCRRPLRRRRWGRPLGGAPPPATGPRRRLRRRPAGSERGTGALCYDIAEKRWSLKDVVT